METTMTRTYKIAIDGMHCHACERLVTANLSGIPGVTVLAADAQDGFAIIAADREPDATAVADAIRAAGFAPTGGTVTFQPVEWTEPAAEPAPVAGLPAMGSALPAPTVTVPATRAEPSVPAPADEPDACPTDTCPTVPPAPDPAIMASSAAAATASAQFGIIGMTCSSCQAVIERTLQRTPGIGSAVVNLAAETATVTFDPHTLGVDDIVAAVRGAGYDAVPRVESAVLGEGDDAQREAQQAHIRKEKGLFLFSLVLSIPLLMLMVPSIMESVSVRVATWLAGTLGGAWDPMMVVKYIGFALATPVQFIAGWQFYKGFYHALKRRTGN